MKTKRLFILLIVAVMILCTVFGAEAHSFYVFYSYKKADPVHYEVVDMTVNGNYVSDHRGLFAKIALK